MTLPKPRLPLPLALAAGLALLVGACDPEFPPPVQRGAAPAQGTGQQALDAALADGCDSPAFMHAVERFTIAHRAAIERTDVGTPTYSQILEAEQAPRLDQVFLASTSLVMNEMHDCQRLIVPAGAGWRYGPLVGLFADPVRLEHPDPEGAVVAEAYNFGGGDYTALGLTAGSNCIWLEEKSGAWSATMLVPAPNPGGPPCAVATPSNALSATSLPTATRSVPGGGADAYPSTTRWMWDDAAGLQYLGLRCENAWCEVVPATVTPNTSAFPNAAAVPGWSDSQYLAWVGPQDTLMVSDLFGTMEPGPAVKLSATAQRQALLAAPGLAAEVTLEGYAPAARQAYREKMDFHATPPGASTTSVERIWMRVQAGSPDVWRAWTDSRGQAAARDLVRAIDIDHSGSGTVRWRWLEDDEAGWLWCRQGCCTYGLI